MAWLKTVNIRIGGEGESTVLGALRETAETGRARSPVSADARGRADEASSGVVIHLSPKAQRYLGAEPKPDEAKPGEAKAGEAKAGEAKADEAQPGRAAVGGQKELTDKDRDVIRKLEARDAEVRAHEAAHMAAAGGRGSGASYDYQTGPDGRRYAVGGEVQVTVPSGGTPDEMIRNAQTMRAAALAPADPSSQDMAVAAQAAQMEAQARQQKEVQRQENAPKAQDKAGAAGENEPAREPETDPLKVFSALKSERMAVQGGNYGHPHALSSCGFCSSAAARYV